MKKFVLNPLSPSQVMGDQVQMRNKTNEEKTCQSENQSLISKDESELGELSVRRQDCLKK